MGKTPHYLRGGLHGGHVCVFHVCGNKSMNELVVIILSIWVAAIGVDIWAIRRTNKHIKKMEAEAARIQKSSEQYKKIIGEYLQKTRGHILIKEDEYDSYVKAVNLYETQVRGNAWALLMKTVKALIEAVQNESISREQMAIELTRLQGIIEEEMAVTETEHIIKTTA
jgi:hypothetical protein